MEKVCGVETDGTLTRKPDAAAGDKGYCSKENRKWLQEHGIKDVIPARAHEWHDPNFDRELYCERNIVERLIGLLKEKRRISSRYEKLAVHFLAMIHVAVILTLL